MKKTGSLTKRAILFTAIIAATMVVVALLVYLLAFGRGQDGMPFVWSLLVGLGAAAIVFYPLLRALILPVSEHIGALRDVAVAVGKGDLDARADERAPGELGQVGKARNDLSYQLSRNMYLLIIERKPPKANAQRLIRRDRGRQRQGAVTHRNPALEKMFDVPAQEHPPRDERLKLIPDRDIWPISTAWCARARP